MNLFSLLFLIIILSISFSLILCGEEDVDELKVEVLHKPDGCERASSRGDMLSMHYKGTLLDGTEFDSRYIS